MKPNIDSLEPLATALINRYQGGFPLRASPFAEIARELDSTEAQVIETLQQLLDAGWCSRFGPLYDAVALGGGLTLAAMSVPRENYDTIVEIVNRYPQVAHNYRREHELNMWFVLATETPEEIITTISSIEQATGLSVYNFPKQREFYVGLWLQIANGRTSTVPLPGNQVETCDYVAQAIDKSIIQLTQAGLPLVAEPWQAIAQQLECDAQTVTERLQHMLASGIIRRIGAVPNHYRLGLKANGMSVWDVDKKHIEQLGKLIGSFDFVSHCYQRPQQLPVWRYSLFAMVHGHDRDEVQQKVTRIADALGNDCDAYDVLYSSAILKKTGLRLAA